jgi:hypothetical protein
LLDHRIVIRRIEHSIRAVFGRRLLRRVRGRHSLNLALGTIYVRLDRDACGPNRLGRALGRSPRFERIATGVPAFAHDKFEVGSGGIAVVKRGLSKDTVKDARADQRPSIGAPARIGVNPSNT